MKRALPLVLCALGCSRAPTSLLSHTNAAPAAIRDATVRPLTPPKGAQVAAIDVGGRAIALVADPADRELALVDLAGPRVVGHVPLEGAPGQVLVDPNGTVFVALRGAAAVVALRFHADLGARSVARHETGDEPFGLALAKDGKTLYVTSIVDAKLEAFRAADLSPVASYELPKDPRSAVVLDDGRVAVSHATGSSMSIVTKDGAVRDVSLAMHEHRRDFGMTFVTKPMALHGSKDDFFFMKKDGGTPKARFSMTRDATQGFGLAAIGDEVFAPEALVLTSDGSAITTGYGAVEQSTLSTHVPFVARVKVAGGKEELASNSFSGPSDRSCFEGTPSCIVPRAVTDDGTNVYIACTDSDTVTVHDPTADYTRAPSCQRARSYQKRIAVEAPTGLALAHLAGGDALVVYSELTRRLTVAPLAGADAMASLAIPEVTPVPADVARGRALFHKSGDKHVSENGRACASCHVDGREDGLVWPTPKGKRQTPMLAGRLVGTEPYDWNGEHATLAVHIQSTLKNLGGVGMPSDDVDALAAYVRSLPAPAKRARASAEARRGEVIFRSKEAQCSSCHEESSRFTDGEAHELPGVLGVKFDTPSLAFVGQTAPYFHDGRFVTLDQLVDGCDGVMGTTRHLSAEDKRALVAYLRTL